MLPTAANRGKRVAEGISAGQKQDERHRRDNTHPGAAENCRLINSMGCRLYRSSNLSAIILDQENTPRRPNATSYR
jgi:hypothetical protein